MHLAAANASDKPHSPLSVLRELLNNPPASAAPSTPSDSGKKLSLTRSGTFAVPSPTVAPWLETRDGDGATPLQCAAFAGHVMATKLLIVAGADLNAADVDGATALHKACARGHVAVIEVLMAADASRDARDHRGQTPLHYAVDADRASALDVLLAHDHEGALFAAADNRGLTLLHRAARRGSRRCLARVRTKFAKRVQPAVVNAVDAEGMTPLHHAALCGSGSCVRQLLALGANAGLLCGGAARLSAAHLAAAAGSVAGLDALLDAQPTLLAATDGSGRTPLDIARSLPKLAAAAAFLEQQERERAPESGESATESGGPAIEVTPRAPAAAQKSVHASISTMEIQNVNRWGFVDPNAQQYAPTEKDIRKEVERGMKWMQMFQQWDKFADSDKLHELRTRCAVSRGRV
jgi:ankyrin repeat protein